ncbi:MULTISPECIES: NAD(P)-binding domain-containing protein [Microbacterium]|uniref:NAD(P)-binding domain-containing protein n=1 Tax=Microbacterium profundi TaxID=450380 RepID=A0ABV3LFD0_9MICO|nr:MULTISPECIES: NAD(P)-binding domain-containing protein [Microbacterium]MCE7481929.1 NAD(P)-binding domain-containing protein [Microbacterium profundi]
MTVPGLSHRRVIIVGAGQAGLAVADALRNGGLVPQSDFTVIDANMNGQRSWASRWHSMALLSDAHHSSIARRPLPGDQSRRPRADEMQDYLASVEASLGIAVMWGMRATGVGPYGRGSSLLLSTNEGPVQTRNVVCATGSSSRPWVPSWAADLIVPGVAIHSADYQFPRQIPAGDVLIIGGGDSGAQIARELAPSHTVTLSVRHRGRDPKPGKGAGRWPWSAHPRSRLPNEDQEAQLQQHGVSIVPPARGADGGQINFEDGARVKPRSVIFATGYLPADDWLPQVVRDPVSRRRRHGTTSIPGLFVAGFPKYSTPGADSFIGVRRDAASIARRILNRP